MKKANIFVILQTNAYGFCFVINQINSGLYNCLILNSNKPRFIFNRDIICKFVIYPKKHIKQ